jgi:hypothetical protein
MSKEAIELTAAKPGSAGFWPWVALFLIILSVAAIRVRLLQVPLERDEGEFAYMGQLMLEGIPPYLQAYNMKLPGIYAAYALVMAVLGQTIGGIHIGLLFINTTAILLLFLLTRRLFSPVAAVVAAAAYALLSLSPTVLGTSAHATQFIVPLVLGGAMLLLRSLDSGGRFLLFMSGLLFGLAFLIKQQAVFFIPFAGIYFTWIQIRVRPLNLKQLASRLALLLFASATPFVVTCILLYNSGCFANFWFWTFSYASQYVSEVPLSDAAHNLATMVPKVMGPAKWIWIAAGIGLTAVFWNRKARVHRAFLCGWTVCSFLCTCPGFYFRNHYFVVMLPAVAMLAGIAASALPRLFSKTRVFLFARLLSSLLVAAALLFPVYEFREFFFQANPLRASRIQYGLCPFPESLDIAEYLRRHTKRDEKIFIFGSEPQICFYANRKSATGYIYVYGLMEIQDYAARMQSELIQEIEKTSPRYAVAVNVDNSWTPRTNSDRAIFTWAKSYFAKHYRTVGLIDMLPDGHYKTYWDAEARQRLPRSDTNVYVLERTNN